MDRSEYYYEVVNDNYLNKQFDCNMRTPTTQYYFDMTSDSGYSQALHPNVKVYQYDPEHMNKDIKSNPLNTINNK